jgi:S-layer homology domain
MLGFPDGTFKPTTALTRAQAAVLLYNVQTNFLQLPRPHPSDKPSSLAPVCKPSCSTGT